MWQCDNCGYTDEDGATFDVEKEEGSEGPVRYCPECGSDEVFLVDEEEEDNDQVEDQEEADDSGEWEEEEEEGGNTEEEW